MNITINPLGFANLIVWAGASVAISYWLSKRFTWTVGLAFGVTALSSLRIFQNTLNGLSLDPTVRLFDMSAESALISVLLTMLIIQSLSIKTWATFFKAVAVVNAVSILADALYQSWGYFLDDNAWREPMGILLNASMSACLNAAIFPIFSPKQKILRALILLSIIVAGRSLPIAVFFVAVGAWLFLQRRYKTIFLAFVGSLAVGFLIKGQLLFEPRGRVFIWTEAYHFFQQHFSYWIGGGLGRFYVIGPYLNTSNGSVFIWLHSDWLQTIFEQGFIGFAAVLLMYGQAVVRARKRPELFVALIAYAAFGVANMPLRYPLSGLFGAFLIRWALEKGEPVSITESV